MLIGMGENSLGKELLDWFRYADDTATTSSFIQQRNKIKPRALKDIFFTIINQCDEHIFYKGYRRLAIDGSNLRLPSNRINRFSYENTKGYNFIHLDALYDLLQHTYIDASVPSKIGMNEHKALVSMIDYSSLSDKTILIADRG